MIDGSYIALSALDAFSKKVAVISNNIANMHTDGYKKSRAILEEGQNGGVEVSIQKIDTPGSPLLYEEGFNVQAEEASNVDPAGEADHNEEAANVRAEETSNVDPAEETVQMIMAQRGYEANLKSLATQNEMQEAILDIMG